MQLRIDIGDTAITVTPDYVYCTPVAIPCFGRVIYCRALMVGGYRNEARYIGTTTCEIEATAQSYFAA